MAYYSGTATSLANLLANFLTNAQADGWTLTGSVLSKAGVFFQLTSDANNVKCLGCESNAAANPAPNVVSIGKIFERSGYTTKQISFPCNYEVFGFAQEIYLVVNYDVDSYQWLAFGKSTVPGLPGPGGWCGATIGAFQGASNYATTAPIKIYTTDGGASSFGFILTAAAMFWANSSDSQGGIGNARNCFVDHNLDGNGWNYDTGGVGAALPIGIGYLSPLHTLQPSAWNSEAVLLPIRAFARRPSYKSSVIADLQYARHLRIDNLAPGDILTIGSDKWKTFPWHRKDAANRDGGSNINATGTFGWAIRYEGP